MGHQTEGFDEKEEYKKLFKIRDEIFMNMQAAMQSSGTGFFNTNMPYGSFLIKEQPYDPSKNSRTSSEEAVNYKSPATSASIGILSKDEKNKLERSLRARIEKRKADVRLMNEQGSSKKHIEQRTFSNQIHYRKTKESWDGTRANTKGPNYDTASHFHIQRGTPPAPKHQQEPHVSESPSYHTEKPKNKQIYCENKDEIAINFLSKSMAIPGLRVPTNMYEENTEKLTTTPATTQNAHDTYNEGNGIIIAHFILMV